MGLVKKVNKNNTITWYVCYAAKPDGTRRTTRDKWEAIGPSKREAAIAWIVTNQLGRRNLTPSQRAALALEIEKQLAAEAKKR